MTVTDGATTEVTGTFIQRGFLKVNTNPAVPATVSVDGAPMDDWGVFTDVPVGTHLVCFGDVTGYTAPACVEAEVAPGDTTTITGDF